MRFYLRSGLGFTSHTHILGPGSPVWVLNQRVILLGSSQPFSPEAGKAIRGTGGSSANLNLPSGRRKTFFSESKGSGLLLSLRK
jgi:hypothetical protein